MMIALERDEVALLRRKFLRDDADYYAAVELLGSESLSGAQMKRLGDLVRAYEAKAGTPNQSPEPTP